MIEHVSATTATAAEQPRMKVLVADDDAASCRFLCDALRSLGVLAKPSHDGLSALAAARTEKFGLLLLDCRMPGAGAMQVLAALRDDPHAASSKAAAIATSADMTPTDRHMLLDAGFAKVLLKPCTVTDLRVMLAPFGVDAGVVLDDRAALDSSGDAATMQALRSLLRAELIQLNTDLDTLEHDHTALAERLHRLRSSCGFCGAAALSQQTMLLQAQLKSGAAPVSLEPFQLAMQATLDALPA